ncbi:hypothetical protein PUN28_000008 [Cardiocondyla obscurior]|uniref:Uncharacterized protein n=1 Tax=Cardiocondyla obscurior TaxID=286306 RepID=A0AAW2GXF3_9HYME
MQLSKSPNVPCNTHVSLLNLFALLSEKKKKKLWNKNLILIYMFSQNVLISTSNTIVFYIRTNYCENIPVRHGFYNIRIAGICDRESTDTEIFTAGCT